MHTNGHAGVVHASCMGNTILSFFLQFVLATDFEKSFLTAVNGDCDAGRFWMNDGDYFFYFFQDTFFPLVRTIEWNGYTLWSSLKYRCKSTYIGWIAILSFTQDRDKTKHGSKKESIFVIFIECTLFIRLFFLFSEKSKVSLDGMLLNWSQEKRIASEEQKRISFPFFFLRDVMPTTILCICLFGRA